MLTKNISLVFALSFFAIAAVAQNSGYNVTNNDLKNFSSSFQVQLQPVANNTAFDLLISNPGKKKLQFTITHGVLGAMIDTTLDSEQYSRRYNFNEADDGKYIVTIKNGKEIFSKEIEVRTVTARNLLMH
jgi:hypothetical protein